MTDNSAQEAQEAALRALERTRRTRRELERRLAERGFDPATTGEALDRLERVGLVNDLEYARAFLREKLARRAVGTRLLRAQLLTRGVSGATADEAMAELSVAPGDEGSPRTEVERARQALAQFSRRYARLDARTRRQRLSAALVRRGFDYDVVAQALAEMEKEMSPAVPRAAR